MKTEKYAHVSIDDIL